MRTVRAWFVRLGELVFRQRRDFELAAEMESHLQMHIEDGIRAGLPPVEARRQAIIALGGVEQTQENYRDRRGFPALEAVIQDVRFGLRLLRKNPGFTAVAVLTLALGIGANTAIFSVINGVLLKPLPFDQPDRLVRIYHTPPQASFPGMPTFSVSAANFLDWRAQSQAFEAMAAIGFARFTLTGKARPEAIPTALVNSAFFPILRARPFLGRAFLEDEDEPGRDHKLVLSYSFWRGHLGGDREIVGKSIELNGEPFTVVGVMGPGFDFPVFAGLNEPVQMWKPLGWTDRQRAVRDSHSYVVVARLNNGVTLKHAQAELDSISSRLAQQYPKDDKGWGAVAIPLTEDLVGKVRPSLLILLGAVAFVLLIACANVANLLLARMLSRRKEIAIRAALGAGQGRLFQQALIETLLLAFGGGLLGLTFAHYGVELIVNFLGQRLPRFSEIGLDGWVLAFTLGASLVTGLAAGLLPSLHLAKGESNQALKESPGQVAADAVGSRTRNVLVVSEVALSLMLLIGAGLLIRSLWILRNTNPGFDPHHVLTMGISIPSSKFADPAEAKRFFQRILERVRTVPGVENAGMNDDLPLGGGGSTEPILAEGWPVVPMSDLPEVDVRIITPGYLSAMRIPRLSGRDFDDSDAQGHAGAVLISQSMAKQFWPNENAIGKHVTLYFYPQLTRVVVGIVADVKEDGLNQKRPPASLYFPLAQFTVPDDQEWRSFISFGVALALRTAQDPLSLATAVSAAVHEIDPEVALLNIRTMDDRVSASLSPQRFTMLLLSAFAGLALLLATVGMFTVISYSVSRRTHEIGIRISLGATRGDVLRLVLRQGMMLAAVGLVIGIIGALALSRLMASVVYGVTTSDPLTFVAVSLLLVCVALLACYIPARRAMRVDPAVALRHE
jgi:putative ABC transport system permease protein